MIMEWQAKFHASGLVYYGEKGPEDECMVMSFTFILFLVFILPILGLSEGLYRNSMIKPYEEFYQNFFELYLNAVKSIPNGDYYAEKVVSTGWTKKSVNI
jgi:hypothetical protein